MTRALRYPAGGRGVQGGRAGATALGPVHRAGMTARRSGLFTSRLACPFVDVGPRRRRKYRPGHPLADSYGVVSVSRLTLFDKLGGSDPQCHWCYEQLSWSEGTALADHLNGNPADDRPENLVPACRGCNANREMGTGYGRRPTLACVVCGEGFKPHRRDSNQRCCSRQCAGRMRTGHKRGTKAAHGTRSRYNYGCRCDACRQTNRGRVRSRRSRQVAQERMPSDAGNTGRVQQGGAA